MAAGSETKSVTLENDLEVPPKIRTRTLHDPAVALSGMYPEVYTFL